MSVILEITNGKNIVINNAIVLAEVSGDDLGVAFYYAPTTNKYVGYITKKSPYQEIKECVAGTPDYVIDVLVEDHLGGNFHPIFKDALALAGANDAYFEKFTLDRI